MGCDAAAAESSSLAEGGATGDVASIALKELFVEWIGRTQPDKVKAEDEAIGDAPVAPVKRALRAGVKSDDMMVT